ncbi:Uncharacterized protein OBRU01_17912 [Operophtera brumata]|uniref:Uncharacterized protein n=1 Tax=Operophtera brumata TaxID=104452 RepID=A0A0L7KYH1_OPEBR|nr:Uncharacterized protein OBRU01_17912 [Operophtera brumata]
MNWTKEALQNRPENISTMRYTLALAIDSSAIYSSAIDSSAIDTSSINTSTVLYEGADIASAPRNRLLHRAYFLRSAIANTIHIHDHTWRGSSVITVVRASEVGASQGASARITAGGVGRTTVTVRFQSLRGRGFHIMLEVWGR